MCHEKGVTCVHLQDGFTVWKVSNVGHVDTGVLNVTQNICSVRACEKQLPTCLGHGSSLVLGAPEVATSGVFERPRGELCVRAIKIGLGLGQK